MPSLPALLRKALQAGRQYDMYYTYVLISKKDNKFYVGWSVDLKHRLAKHQKGEVIATSNRLPIELVYYEACLSKEKAIAREKELKSGYGRAYLKRRLE